MKYLKTALLITLVGAAFATTGAEARAGRGHATKKPKVELVTSMGTIVLELDASKAPKTVKNFLSYVKSGHYDGTVFHRVIDGFMIQGGGYTAKLQQKETKAPVENEADNGLKNLRGTISMARTSDPNSATAQFFINVVDNPALDFRSKDARGWGYTVFGRVVQGMKVVDQIKAVKTGPQGMFGRDVPQTPVVIQSAKLIGKRLKRR